MLARLSSPNTTEAANRGKTAASARQGRRRWGRDRRRRTNYPTTTGTASGDGGPGVSSGKLRAVETRWCSIPVSHVSRPDQHKLAADKPRPCRSHGPTGTALPGQSRNRTTWATKPTRDCGARKLREGFYRGPDCRKPMWWTQGQLVLSDERRAVERGAGRLNWTQRVVSAVDALPLLCGRENSAPAAREGLENENARSRASRSGRRPEERVRERAFSRPTKQVLFLQVLPRWLGREPPWRHPENEVPNVRRRYRPVQPKAVLAQDRRPRSDGSAGPYHLRILRRRLGK